MCVLCSIVVGGDVSLKRPVSVRALQYSGGWGRQSQERPVNVRALQYSGGWGRQPQERPVSVHAGARLTWDVEGLVRWMFF